MRHDSRLLTLLFGLVAVLSGGCVSTPPLSSEIEGLKSGGHTLVLFRMTTVGTNTSDEPKALKQFQTRIGNLDTWRELSPSGSGRGLSAATTREGWRYVILPPGNYYLQFAPVDSTIVLDNSDYLQAYAAAAPAAIRGSPQAEFGIGSGREAQVLHGVARRLPAYRLVVPVAQPALYAGSFCWEIWPNIGFNGSEKVSNTSWKNKTPAAFVARPPVDETELARTVTAKTVPELGEVMTSLASSYDELDDIARARLGGTLDVAPGAKEKLSPKAIRKPRPMIFLDATADLAGSIAKGGAPSDPFAAAAFFVAALPVALAGDTIREAAHKKKWEPLEKELKRGVQDFGLEKRLVEALQAKLGVSPGPTAAAGAEKESKLVPDALVVQLATRRIALRESAHHRLSLEVAVQVRLLNSESGYIAWEHSFVRCNPEAVAWQNGDGLSQSLYPFETPIRATAASRPLTDYKHGAGPYVIELELKQTVHDLAEDLAARLQQADR